ncbi:MAG: ATP-binding protein [Actinomycetota bacterium]
MVTTGDDVAAEADREPRIPADHFRSVAQLNMLHSLAAKLNSLGDAYEISSAITAELRTIVDYHSCRVYLLQPDGRTLYPVSFRGEMFSDYEKDTVESLITEIGEGITGHVAESRDSLITPDARDVAFAVQIPGTDDVLESMLAVPMAVGDQLLGVITLSMLGYGKFDEEDQRLLEVLASHAAVALQNAKLFQAEREAAETSTSLLHLSQSLTQLHSVEDILQEAMDTVPHLVVASGLAAYLRDEETGDFHLLRLSTTADDTSTPAKQDTLVSVVPSDVATAFLSSESGPFVVPRDVVQQVPPEYRVLGEVREVLVAPLRWEPDGFGAIVLAAKEVDARFTDQDLRLARGIADITSLALGNARRLSELERFHELVASLDAVYWEADAASLRLSFIGGRAEQLLGANEQEWIAEGRRWGDHTLPEDREDAVTAARIAADAGQDQSLEYRVSAPDGRTIWIRDMVHVVRSAQGPRQLRGLMIDITERKRAEQALRRSERKYSEAFRREREAAQRLRALDEMKNTFLEAVSHDLRTPLTSILGSALTLEQTELNLPKEDALDLVGRIAANARKLERLLSDLLDLDRLQRGIVSPQRRPTDLAELVHRSVEGTENPAGRDIEVEVESITVSVDAAKVERILENLLSNAIRHTPDGTRIWIRGFGQDGGVMLIVEDEGHGIPHELHEAVFEPFRQAPGSSSGHSPGVGVGLSLVRRFAELHGGRAWLEDRDGGGSSFHVFLPGG